MRVNLLICFLVAFNFVLNAKNKYSNKVYANDIRTLQVLVEGDTLEDPIIHMGTDDKVSICFDEMSHRPHFYSYRVRHCESDWSISENLLDIDYIKGINDNKIEDSYESLNTTFEYTHYYFSIPNDNIELTASGNYVVEIYDSDKPDSVIANACFMISEDAVNVDAKVSVNTEYGVKNKYQQLDFSLDCSSLLVSDPKSQVKIRVQQNGRKDIEVDNLLPTYVEGNLLHYSNNRNLIFEAGNEFYRIDFSHIRNYTGLIDNIYFDRPYYHVSVYPGKDNTHEPYKTEFDVNGRFKIHSQDIWSEKEIDYSIVHFSFIQNEPWIDGKLYVAGYFNENNLDDANQMKYNYDTHQYELTTILKNGGYNYQYLFVPAGLKKGVCSRTMGNHWQSVNEYKIYIYYHPFGQTYDRLVGVETIESYND